MTEPNYRHPVPPYYPRGSFENRNLRRSEWVALGFFIGIFTAAMVFISYVLLLR